MTRLYAALQAIATILLLPIILPVAVYFLFRTRKRQHFLREHQGLPYQVKPKGTLP